MTVERAPYKRPSLPGILHDSSDRVQSLEAAQMMPYQVGACTFNWPPDTTMPAEIGGTNDTVMLSVVFNDPDQFGDYHVDTTDSSIFSCPDAAGGGGQKMYGGGLFYFHASVLVAGDSFNTATASVGISIGGGSYMIPDYRVDSAIAPRIFALYPSYPNANLQMGLYPDYIDGTSTVGWVSDLGFPFDPAGDPRPGPYSSSYLYWTFAKGLAGDNVTFVCTWMIARWTPIGFAVWAPE